VAWRVEFLVEWLGGVTSGHRGIVGAVPTPARPPPAEAAPKKPENLQACTAIEAGLLVRQVKPLIARQGRRRNRRIESRYWPRWHGATADAYQRAPLFVQAAIEAVRQWLYRPTYLNGQAVEAIIEVDVPLHMT
jgi:protein TonB